MLFEDRGGVGRVPKVAPVTWKNDWPMIGVNGNMKVPATYTKPAAGNGVKSPGTDDDFSAQGYVLSQWQWNHNPDNSKWTGSERPGWLRLKTSYAPNLLQARNTLGQRIQGPTSSGWVKLDATNIKPGQIAGLSAFHAKYGYIAVKNDNGTKKLVQYNVTSSETSVNLTNNIVYLKVDADCNAQTAKFYYSYDENNWTLMGGTLGMDFFYQLWFIGYRFALFNYTIGSDTSGYADFDFFNFSPTATGTSTSAARVECENITKGGPYAGNITLPFNGVALYANGDYCTSSFNFASGKTYTISVRGTSNNSSTAKVSVYIGGAKRGTLSFAGTTASVQSLNVSLSAGVQEVKLLMEEDTGDWDTFVDYYEIHSVG